FSARFDIRCPHFGAKRICLQETPNRQGRHRQRHQERLTRASREAARAAQAATTAKKREPTSCRPAPRVLRAEEMPVERDVPLDPGEEKCAFPPLPIQSLQNPLMSWGSSLHGLRSNGYF